MKPAAEQPAEGHWLIDWGGAQRWLRGADDPGAMETVAVRMGGQVALYRGGDRDDEVFHSRTAVQKRLHLSLKRAFDPLGIFNPGRLYGWM